MYRTATLLLLLALAAGPARQSLAADARWQDCATLGGDDAARLACYDRWAARQGSSAPSPASATVAPPAPKGGAQGLHAPQGTESVSADGIEPPLSAGDGCRDDRYTVLSRFWELEAGSDCGALRFRGYRPLSVSVVASDQVNQRPTSGNPLNDASSAIPYKRSEMRMQLSVRTKLARGLLTRGDMQERDSLWAAYSQQSYWQLFSPALSRPFRNTDHEPELIYVYPTTAELPWGWRWRYSGLGLVHQSNGQSLPLSRSWNRVYLMAGFERGDDWLLMARIWQRLREDPAKDDNPGISDYIGRSEFTLGWNATGDDTLALTLRHSLRATARGSVRVEWLHRLGSDSNLRLHTALFSGYGDSLVDYNRRRTVFSVGLSLLDF